MVPLQLLGPLSPPPLPPNNPKYHAFQLDCVNIWSKVEETPIVPSALFCSALGVWELRGDSEFLTRWLYIQWEASNQSSSGWSHPLRVVFQVVLGGPERFLWGQGMPSCFWIFRQCDYLAISRTCLFSAYWAGLWQLCCLVLYRMTQLLSVETETQN